MNEEQIMTEKDYEKSYKEALERARVINSGKDVDVEAGITICEYIFPELKMNDDDRIRKDIIRYLKESIGDEDIISPWLTWLEKQGKSIRIKKGKNYLCTKTHKYAGLEWIEGVKYYSPEDYSLVNQGCTYHCPEYSKEEHNDFFREVEYDGCVEVDNVKPKFKVGDWVVCECDEDSATLQIKNIIYGTYEFTDDSTLDVVDEDSLRLWTINDAKDGDVLVNGSNIFIFHFINDTRLMGYCHVNVDDGRFYDDMGKNECFCLIDAVVNPATKEQRDLLFQKMKEADWKWNAEKKELKKNNSYCIENCKGYQETGKCFADGGCDAYHKAEQKSVEDSMSKEKTPDKVKPKFTVGDWVVFNGLTLYVKEVVKGFYRTISKGDGIANSYDWDIDNVARLWTIQDAKDGDVLAGNKGDVILMFRRIGNTEYNDVIDYHCYYDCYWKEFIVQKDLQYWGDTNNNQLKPATKEQHDILFQKMKEAGYEFDFDNKDLKKIDDEECNGEDYGIDGLWHAQRILEKTLGDVDGYQSDDGILEHKAAITAVKKLCEKKPDWSDEDEENLNRIIGVIERREMTSTVEQYKDILHTYVYWLKSLKTRVQPNHKIAWSDEDEKMYKVALSCIVTLEDINNGKNRYADVKEWLKSFKDRVQPQPKEWSDEDEAYKEFAISAVEDYYDEENPLQKELVGWLKSFKDKLSWKPSKEQMETLEYYMHTLLATEHKEVLFGLYNDLKKL